MYLWPRVSERMSYEQSAIYFPILRIFPKFDKIVKPFYMSQNICIKKIILKFIYSEQESVPAKVAYFLIYSWQSLITISTFSADFQ